MRRLTLMMAALVAAICAIAAPTPKVVWQVSTDSISPTEGKIVWKAKIEDGFHIYGFEKPAHADFDIQTTQISVMPGTGYEVTGPVTPSVQPTMHTDHVLNIEIQWWAGEVTFTQPFRLTDGATGAHIVTTVAYMACNDVSCTSPKTEEFSLNFGSDLPKEEEAEPTKAVAAAAAPAMTPEDSEWWQPVEITSTSVPQTDSVWYIFIMGFLGGLLALLTPCVWPMIPMTVSFFLKSNKDKHRSILNAVIYGLSIIVIFLALGLAVTLIFDAGKLNSIATSAVFNIIFFLLLVVFAISFFGAFDIKLPAKWSNAVDEKAETTTGYLSIFFMAFTLVLVSFSCTGPIIGTLLVEAASEGAIIGPTAGMGGFALGLAIPFALFAIFPSFLRSMPKSGGWLNSVKVVLGFIELILSLKFLSVADLAYGWRLLDREVFIAIWIVLFALLGMYLLGKLRFSHDSESKHTSVLGFFLATISFSFAVYLVPGLWGAPLKAISAFAPPLSTQDFNLYGGGYREFDDYDEGMRYAEEHHMPVLIDFTGYGCVNCRKMEMAVFDTPDVRNIIENNYVLIKLYVDEKKALSHPYVVDTGDKPRKINTVGDKWSYLEEYKFGTASQPFYVLLNNQGQPLAPSREYDENVSAFIKWLELGIENYNK